MKTAISALTIIAALTAANASAAITTVTCKNRHSFNYGFLELTKTDTETTIVMSATNMQGVGRKLIAGNNDPSRQVKFTLPSSDCVLMETGSRLPLRCYNSTSGATLEITDFRGVVHQVPVDYASLETVVRMEESLEHANPQHLVVAQPHFIKGSGRSARVVQLDVNFDFNECVRTDRP